MIDAVLKKKITGLIYRSVTNFTFFILTKNPLIKKVAIRLLLKAYFIVRSLSFQIVNYAHSPKICGRHGAQRFYFKHLSPQDYILDLGCSSGELTKILSQRVNKVDAMDISNESISYARKHNSRNNIDYFCKDINSIEFPLSRKYDVVILGAVLSFANNPSDLLKKLSQCSKKILIRETKYDSDILSLVAADLGIKRNKWKEFSKQELLGLLSTAEYKIIEDNDTYDMFIAAIPEQL